MLVSVSPRPPVSFPYEKNRWRIVPARTLRCRPTTFARGKWMDVCTMSSVARVAQWIEHRSPKAGVARSNRVPGTILFLIVKQASAKTNQEQLLEILELCYGKAVDGIPRVDKSVDELVSDYSSRYPTARKAEEALVANHLVKCTASGVATSFGGVATLPLTVSANVVSVLYFQLRMIAAVAKLGGYDPKTDQVRTMAYVCLAGQSANEALKSAGVQFGTRFMKASIMKVSGKTITKINHAVGFRLVIRMGKTGVINLHRLVPVVGGIIGGGVDLATTKIIADNVMKMFIAELPDPPAQA